MVFFRLRRGGGGQIDRRSAQRRVPPCSKKSYKYLIYPVSLIVIAEKPAAQRASGSREGFGTRVAARGGVMGGGRHTWVDPAAAPALVER